jgi:hypothetical protein
LEILPLLIDNNVAVGIVVMTLKPPAQLVWFCCNVEDSCLLYPGFVSPLLNHQFGQCFNDNGILGIESCRVKKFLEMLPKGLVAGCTLSLGHIFRDVGRAKVDINLLFGVPKLNLINLEKQVRW